MSKQGDFGINEGSLRNIRDDLIDMLNTYNGENANDDDFEEHMKIVNSKTEVKKVEEVVDEDDETYGEINIDDYIPADEEQEFGHFTNLLNIFTCYFKQLFMKNQETTMFDNIDHSKKDSTNKCMEFMYEEMFKFNKSLEEDKDMLYDPDDGTINIDLCEELYILYIDSEPKYVCKFILPLLQHIGTLEWTEINWSVIKIKG